MDFRGVFPVNFTQGLTTIMEDLASGTDNIFTCVCPWLRGVVVFLSLLVSDVPSVLC